jgi:Asp-tRNA(Asn)/Glu-tRNA(Gln) amidotransferase A subunit family amidase
VTELHDLGVSDAARAIAAGQASSEQLTSALLERIDRLDGGLRAWVSVDRARSLAEARARDAAPAGRRGALHGVPIGVKDIFDVAGAPTGAGFAPFAGRIAVEDATAVARLRAAGAVILGKTVTTQFAYMDPPPTRNPWSTAHTPGGSSSGSGAAVGARMVPGALGSQTGGSVLRPAAYCGVVGLKPSYGRVSRRGVLPLAWTLDHPGVLCRSVEDAARLLGAIAGPDPADPGCSARPADDYVAAVTDARPPRLLVLDDFLARAQPEAQASFERTVQALARAGATVVRGAFPSRAETLISTHALLMQSETASVHRRILAEHGDAYAPRIRAYVELGLTIPAVEYVDAQRLRRRLRAEARRLLGRADCLVLPTVSGPAPAPDTTGDPTFQGPFSMLGLPAITVPSALTGDGRPLGLQLVGRDFGEAELLRAAAWCERVLPGIGAPPFATLAA